MYKLHRLWHIDNSIIGVLEKNSRLVCWTLERFDRIIPGGTYDLKLTWSPKFNQNMPEVMNVPGRDGIRIHIANFSQELEGCIALGNILSGNWIGESRLAWESFFAAFKDSQIIINEVPA